MSQPAEDVFSPSFTERRRPMQVILPTENEELPLSSTTWSKVASLILSVALVTGAYNYMKYQGKPSTPNILYPGLGVFPLYEWFGYHRVAP